MRKYAYGGKQDADRVNELIRNNDSFVILISDKVIKKSEELLLAQPETKQFDRKSFNGQFHIENIDFLSFAYLLTDREEFLSRAKLEMNFISELPDWQPFKFLNTSACSLALSIGYDRLKDFLSESEKQKYKNAVLKLGFEPVISEYENAEKNSELKPGEPGWWCLTPWNWNAVCNCGMICAAVVWKDEYPEISSRIIENALKFIKLFFDKMEPDGAWTEGIGYWLYANYYISRASCMLKNYFGTDYGMCDRNGFKKTVLYAEYMNHDSFNFNFHDCGVESRINTTPIMYYAERLGMPFLGQSRVRAFEKGFFSADDAACVSDLIWYKAEYSEAGNIDFEDIFFEGSDEAILVSDDIAFAFHGGYTLANHGHIDCGTFILDSRGERWFSDLGKDMLTYNGAGEDFSPYNVYRIRTEGHNSIVINPSIEPGQKLGSSAKIVSFKSAERYCVINMDLSDCYPDVDSVSREILFDKKDRKIVITDTAVSDREFAFYSFMHTGAEISVSGGGAILKKGSKQIRILSNYPLSVMDAEPLDTSPRVQGQADNSSFKKLCYNLSHVHSVKILTEIYL